MTLLVTCVMALWPTLLPIQDGSEGGVALVLTDTGIPSALPAPIGAETFDAAGGSEPTRDRPADGDPRFRDAPAGVSSPPPAEHHRVVSGSALLGLLAAPANAPPLG
jgi:hypothetical protein